MRPLKLKMTAFGSYAKETVVDFEELGSGVYLIAGDTGAGKTTIFKAILYALFGDIDGSRPRELHSDFAGQDVATEVELLFEERGKLYTVKRTIKFRKSGDIAEDAELREPDDKPVVEQKKRVTARVEEIIGLNKEQFSNIVMLPQGEFHKFLRAKSNEREEILSRLFNNRIYELFQKTLKKAAKKLHDEREDSDRLIKSRAEEIINPLSLSEEDKARCMPPHPDFLSELQRLVELDGQRSREAEGRREELSRRRDEIRDELSKAEDTNKRLDDLRECASRFERLSADKPRFDSLRGEIELLGRALPAGRERRLLLMLLGEEKELAAERLTLEAAGRELSERLARREEAVACCAKPKARLEREVNPAITLIENALPRYAERETLKARELSLHAEREKILSEKESAESRASKLADEIERLNADIAAIGDPEKDIMALGIEIERKSGRLEELKALKRGIGMVRSDTQLLSEIIAAASERQAECERLEREYNRLYRAFLADRAAALSGELRKEIAEKGRGVCPVCGSELCSADGLPAAEETHIDERQLDDAKRRLESAQAERDKRENDRRLLEAQISDRQRDLAVLAERLLSRSLLWEELSGGAADDALSACEAELALLSQKKRELEESGERLARLRQEAECRGTERSEAESRAAELLKRLHDRETELSGIVGRLEGIKLEYSSQSEAEEALDGLRREKAGIEDEIKRAEEALNQTKREIAGNDNALEKNARDSEETSQRASAQRAVFEAKLCEAGFADEAALDAALGVSGGADGEEWLRERREELSEFDSDLRAAGELLENARKAAEGLSRADTGELRARLDEVNAECDRAKNEAQELHTVCAQNERCLREIREELDKTAKGSELFGRVQGLAEAAEPSGSGAAKVTFARYIIQSVFKDILAEANKRFSEMSSGRYKFVYENEAKDKRSAAGLELVIYDNRTCTKRRAEAISGGESFVASLSLALGLSDAVQSRAGGITVNTMFIDEGFGTLDDSVLDTAVNVLNSLACGSRQVGIISHVEKLEESIPKKLRILSGKGGSSIRVEI